MALYYAINASKEAGEEERKQAQRNHRCPR
jgi:hypothetical protein